MNIAIKNKEFPTIPYAKGNY